MSKRSDLKSILIIGSGPIVIGQACEFDYSGTQACRALVAEGYRVILVNSNPATIMTDPNIAHATYIEPINWQTVAKIIEKEKPSAVLPTMGGQTALNCAMDLGKHGILERFNVELIGASAKAIEKAENREQFRRAMQSIGLEMARSFIAHNLEEALEAQTKIGFPCIIRPSFTLGGTGGGIAYNLEDFNDICQRGLEASPTQELLIEESLLGWKEFEMEVVRDKEDNCIIVCSIENFDPMGIHTGDSITVAPAQTLTDKEYQIMRNASIAILREIGVDTGGSNVQFAVHPDNGRLCVVEMNPRVSRSSALASKATGFPIAKVAAKLAVGYTLNELKNEITQGQTPASFEPSIDYVVTKIPRFNFEKFPQTDARLTTQMKAVGEVMAIGRTFQESLQKALRSMETGLNGLNPKETEVLAQELSSPGPDRILYVGEAFRAGWSLDQVYQASRIDPWFLSQIEELIQVEQEIKSEELDFLTIEELYRYKRLGFSDARIANLMGVSEKAVREQRYALKVHPVYKRVDTCAAEFSSSTAYLYSTYETVCEAKPSDREKIIILGSGPNRIGQGIEFDYCCVHAALALREDGYETIMVNCNPETVSTDYDISDRLYFEPLTLEDVLEIIRIENPKGVIVQFGGQTPLKLARALEEANVPIIGTAAESIDIAEDRERFQQILHTLNLLQPPNRIVKRTEEGARLAEQVGYPVIVRPSYVLGGRAMEVVYNSEELERYLHHAVKVSEDAPVLLDRFLEDAIEVDVDAVCDGEEVLIGGVMEHIEEAGVHSGDSACSLPPFTLTSEVQKRIKEQTVLLAKSLKVIGLMNVQYAIQNGFIFVLEVNPRSSRTVPFVSKATGLPLAKIAVRTMVGQTLAEQKVREVRLDYYSVKEAVFPFDKFPGVDPILGPEMKSTGEVMGIGERFSIAFAKAQQAGGTFLKPGKLAFLSVRDKDKAQIVTIGKELLGLGFALCATRGTAEVLKKVGLPCEVVNKVSEGRPHIVDKIKSLEIDYIVNTTSGRQAIADSYSIRRTALQHRVIYTTTISGARAGCMAMKETSKFEVESLQNLHKKVIYE